MLLLLLLLVVVVALLGIGMDERAQLDNPLITLALGGADDIEGARAAREHCVDAKGKIADGLLGLCGACGAINGLVRTHKRNANHCMHGDAALELPANVGVV